MTATSTDADRTRLNELGYAQELDRKMSWFSNFAISFSIISILAGGTTTYFLAGLAGGPRMIVLGWVIVGFFALMVGMAMAEIVSVYPTAGGLYYWSGKLAKKNGPMWSWFTGWFNLIGQIGVIASVDYALALFTAYLIGLFDNDFVLDKWNVFIIFVIMLTLHGAHQLLRREPGQAPGRHQRLVARDRRGDHLRRADGRPRRARGLRLHLRVEEPHRLDQHGHHRRALRLVDRLAAGAVHDHRLRRLGPRLARRPTTPAAAPRSPSCAPSTSRRSPP